MQETRLTILYIGDDDTSARLIKRSLQARRYKFRQAVNGLDGIEIASRKIPDLILVDISLSDIDSSILIARLRIIPHIKDKPIIIIASHSQLNRRRLVSVSGCDGYIAKPINVEQLFLQISRFFENNRQKASEPESLVMAADMIRRLKARLKELTVMNRRLQEDNEQLRALDNRRARFFSVVSHDLRTPFTPIRGYIDLLHDGAMGELNEKQQQAINIVAENLNNALGLLDDLLDLSKLQARSISLSKELFSIQSLLDEIVRGGKAYVENDNVTFAVDIADNLPLIYGDRNRIRQVILNLLNNAAKFTGQGSITLTAQTDKDNITIRVKDTGSGLLPEEIPDVLDEFWRSETIRAKGLGTGLGLAICMYLVQAHDGKIWLESEKDVGTTVSFTIPIVEMQYNKAAKA